MTFEELWPTLPIPAEYDSMDETDQIMWRLALRSAYAGGRCAAEGAKAMTDLITEFRRVEA